jgi:hypothetical protein
MDKKTFGVKRNKQGEGKRMYLQDKKENEVSVGQPKRLFHQVLWQESENVVLGGGDVVILQLKHNSMNSNKFSRGGNMHSPHI